MDYNLDRLGEREFEHLTQALTLKLLGPGVEVFGDGPDGGREATFEGRLAFPEPDSEGPWEGYGVVQAKFHYHPRDVKHNADWLKDQLRAELQAWVDPSSKRERRPEYFLVVTNVRLSPYPKVGGIDTVEKLIDEHAPAIGLKGWRVWHYDQLCRLLEGQYEVASKYFGMIAPGDVLVRLHDYLQAATEDLAEVLTAQAASELQADRLVRLEQAGDTTGQGLPLHAVAIDLPAVVRNVGESLSVNVAAHVIARGDRVLRPSSDTADIKKAIVILGGPGQGKSTLAQLLCQMYRVALLSELPAYQLTEPVRSLCEAFCGKLLGEIGVTLPTARRWPVHIRFDQYADAMAKDGDLPLLQYIASRVNRYASVPVTGEQLAGWLKNWPWLLVLDGLDEVVDERTRERLLSNVEVFQQYAAVCGADLLTVATTRPQGYGGWEFKPDQYEYLDLRPLDADMAVRYAERLAVTRYTGDGETQERVVNRVKEGVGDERTAHLMRSPLQVTIMSLLLARRSKAPRHRYELFKEYYETTFAREVAKPTPDARLLDRHAEHVHILQEIVGLALQMRSERQGDAEATMSQQEVKICVERLLHEEDYDADTVDFLAGKLVGLTMNRLVLLVPKPGAGIGFEVRSLQEFMAARALVSGPETQILHNLRTLAPSAHWRNTWLLAAGKLFAERNHLRAELLQELLMVDTTDSLHMCAVPGAHVAVDLLEERVADVSPKYQTQLVKHALELLKSPPDLQVLRLARVLAEVMAEDPSTARIVEAAVPDALKTGGVPTLSAMMLCAAWAGETGPLAGKARSWLAPAWDDLKETGGKRWAAAVALVVNYPLNALREQIIAVPERGRPARVADFLAPLIARESFEVKEKSLVDLTMSILSEADMWHEGVVGIDVVRVDQTSIPGLVRLDESLTSSSVASAVVGALENVGLPHWPVVSLVRRIIGIWVQRRAVGGMIVVPPTISP